MANKKDTILYILQILEENTDEEHTLSQKEIMDILKKEQGITVDRKTIKRNLQDLIEAGYDVNYEEKPRKIKNKKTGKEEEAPIMTNIYINRQFTDAELRLLIDGLLFSKQGSVSNRKQLIGKLEGLSNKYFNTRVKHINTVPVNGTNNRQLFYTIEVLDEAIGKKKQVTFKYASFGTDKKLHNKKDGKKDKVYVVNPYQMAAVNGRYYLICNSEGHDNVAHYRLDKIRDVEMLESNVRPAEEIDEFKNGFDLHKHMVEHIYMFSGESARVEFWADKTLLDDVFDWFDTDISIMEETEGRVKISVMVNLDAMRIWARQYMPRITVVSPKSLVENIEKDLEAALENYEEVK